MKKMIYIDGKRNGYSPDQCGRTLTVQDLMDILEGFDPEATVFIRNDGGYTYGSITEMDIDEEWEEDEEEEEYELEEE
jgi:hypothetical protein